MSIVLITGDHPRHDYLAAQLYRTGLVTGWIREVREAFVPAPPETLSRCLRDLFVHHFEQRELAEAQFFGGELDVPSDALDVSLEELNGQRTREFLRYRNPRIVISYGCHKLDLDYLNVFEGTFWNTHGGLSPEYRGVITHFWPSYFLEPQMTGMTLHETTNDIDGGAILFQSSAKMVSGDSLHRLAARTVRDFARRLPEILTSLDLVDLPRGVTQKSTGRLFKASDWRPEHLTVIYDQFDDRIVDAVLKGELQGRVPRLVNVFVD